MEIIYLLLILTFVFILAIFSKSLIKYKNINLINKILIFNTLLLIELFNVKDNINNVLNFNYIQFFALLSISFLFYNIINKDLLKSEVQIDEKFEKIIKKIGLIGLIIIIFVSFNDPNKYYLKIPLNYENFNIAKNPYPLLFEGFLNGHLYINIEPDPGLALLENPYAYRPNVDYLWDFCYYNNHYYIYFGVAPVILFYFPIYFLTLGHAIPSYELVNLFLYVLSFVFSTLAFIRVTKHFTKKTNPILLIILSLTLFICGGYGLLRYADGPLYNTPILCGTTFMYILIYYTFKAVEENNKISFGIVGFSFIVILASRPNLAIIILPLLVILVPYLLIDIKKNIFNVLPCFIILFFGMMLLGSYNYLRFGNVLDFGSNYQLTVSDISKNKVLLENIPAAMFYYLFQPPRPIENMPHLILNLLDVKWFNLNHYVYTFPTIGLFTIPLSYMIFMGFSRKNSFNFKLMNTLFLLNIIILAIFDFSLAGVHIRYLMDLLPMTMFISIVNIAILINNTKNKNIVFGVCFIVICLSIYYFLNLYTNEWYINLTDHQFMKKLIYNLII